MFLARSAHILSKCFRRDVTTMVVVDGEKSFAHRVKVGGNFLFQHLIEFVDLLSHLHRFK